MTAILETSTSSLRFSPEEIERKLYESGKRDYLEYREFWLPLMQEERRREAENTQDESPKTPK